MAYGSKSQNIWLVSWSNCWSARCRTMNWFMLWLEAKVVRWACSNSGCNTAQIDKKNYLDFSLESYYCTPVICADHSCSHMNCEINDAIKWYIDKLCTLMQWFWDQFGGDVGIFSEVHLTRYLLTCVYTVLLKFVGWNLHCHWLVAVICSSRAAISRVGREMFNVPPQDRSCTMYTKSAVQFESADQGIVTRRSITTNSLNWLMLSLNIQVLSSSANWRSHYGLWLQNGVLYDTQPSFFHTG
jgi:hypothetical protein